MTPYVSYTSSFDPSIGTDGITGALFKPVTGEQFEVGVKYAPDFFRPVTDILNPVSDRVESRKNQKPRGIFWNTRLECRRYFKRKSVRAVGLDENLVRRTA